RVAEAADDDLAVSLDGHPGGLAVAAAEAEVNRLPAIAAEGGIEGAVGVEAGEGHQRIVGGPVELEIPRGNDLAIGLDGDGRCLGSVRRSKERQQTFAVAVEHAVGSADREQTAIL